MDTVHSKISAMMHLYSMLHPALLQSDKLRWQMHTDTAVALLKTTEYRVLGQSVIMLSKGMECLGIPVEYIEADEINLVFKVV